LKKSITVTRFIVLFMTTGYLWLCLNTIWFSVASDFQGILEISPFSMR
jgi:hypothetical protein